MATKILPFKYSGFLKKGRKVLKRTYKYNIYKIKRINA